MVIEIPKIEKMYEFLRLDNLNLNANYKGLFVFCRADPLIAHRAIELLEENYAKYALLTGGVGKDSGNLTIPESHYQRNIILENGIDKEKIIVEDKARNGGENTRLGLMRLLDFDSHTLFKDLMLCVSHPTNSRRVLNTHRHTINTEIPAFYDSWWDITVTNYQFNPKSPIDQAEAVGEMLRLADWPSKGRASEDPELDLELVQYAREIEPQIQSYMKTTANVK